MADVFYRAPGADAFDLWSGDSHDPRDVHSAYEAMSRQEQDLAAARRRAAAHADARRYEPRLRRLSSGTRSPYGSPGSRRLAPGEARRRDAAATRIQRIWRGGSGRSVATDRWVAVFQIQRFWRGALGRRRARSLRRAKKARDEAEARAEEIDDITASVRARRERRTPGLPLAFDDEINASPFQRAETTRVRFTPKKKIDWDAEPFSVEEGDAREKDAARFTDSAFFETAREDSSGARETGKTLSPLSSFRATHRASDETPPSTRSPSTKESLSASLASQTSAASSEHQSLFDEVDAVLLNAKLARRRLLGKSPASPGGGVSLKLRVAPSFGAGFDNSSPSSDLSNDYQHWYSDDASPASAERPNAESTPSGAESRDSRAQFFRSEFAELASSSAASSVDGDAHEKRERMSRYAAALASASGGVQRGNASKGVRIRTELLPPTRPVSARRSPSPPRRFPTPSAKRASVEPSTRDGNRATPASIKARYEAARLEEERAFEEQMKTLRRKEREANARAAAAAEAAEAAAFLAASPGPRESFPSLDDTAGSLGDLDLGPGRVPTGIGRSPSQSPSTRRPAARASPKEKDKVLPLFVGFK